MTGGVSLDGTLAVNKLANYGVGAYRLFNYTGTKFTMFNTVVISNTTRKTWTLDESTNGQVNLIVSGSYGNLPEVTPQPSNQKPPSIPGSISYPFFCSYSHGVVYEVKISLSWFDPGHDANGFHVYRFDIQVADLPASTTSFQDTTDVAIGSQLKYSVEAYNDVGVSPRATITINSICTK